MTTACVRPSRRAKTNKLFGIPCACPVKGLALITSGPPSASTVFFSIALNAYYNSKMSEYLQFRLDLDKRDSTARQLIDPIRAASAAGCLNAGGRLPIERKLAAAHSINVNTVALGVTCR